jgi:hypothetical protein
VGSSYQVDLDPWVLLASVVTAALQKGSAEPVASSAGLGIGQYLVMTCRPFQNNAVAELALPVVQPMGANY